MPSIYIYLNICCGSITADALFLLCTAVITWPATSLLTLTPIDGWRREKERECVSFFLYLQAPYWSGIGILPLGHYAEGNRRWTLHCGAHHAWRHDSPAGDSSRRRRDSRDKQHARSQQERRRSSKNTGILSFFNFPFFSCWGMR